MPAYTTRREFIRRLGLGAAALPFVCNLPSLGFANTQGRKHRLLTLHGVCDKVRGDGDNHMRGMGCLLTGIELFPGNIQGGSDTPAGWASGLSIDQEIKNYLQVKDETRTRFGSLEFGVVVPD